MQKALKVGLPLGKFQMELAGIGLTEFSTKTSLICTSHTLENSVCFTPLVTFQPITALSHVTRMEKIIMETFILIPDKLTCLLVCCHEITE